MVNSHNHSGLDLTQLIITYIFKGVICQYCLYGIYSSICAIYKPSLLRMEHYVSLSIIKMAVEDGSNGTWCGNIQAARLILSLFRFLSLPDKWLGSQGNTKLYGFHH